jgi:hypothetical protein
MTLNDTTPKAVEALDGAVLCTAAPDAFRSHSVAEIARCGELTRRANPRLA